MPPDFSSLTYWTHRFLHFEPPSGFEWLSPPSSLHQLFLSHLPQPSSAPAPRVLHIGSGTSSLSNSLRHWVAEQDLGPERVVNVDYSEIAVQWGRDKEADEFGEGPGMGWETVNLLAAESVSSLATSKDGLFSIIIEKSTADALSCGPLVEDAQIEPLLVLARNLALVTREGGVWLAMSYSLMRFDESVLGGWWKVEEVVKVPVPVKEEEGAAVGRPTMEHGIWVLRRTGTEVEVGVGK